MSTYIVLLPRKTYLVGQTRLNKMWSKLVLILAFLAVIARAQEGFASTSTFKPEGCEAGPLSKAGDQLSMHYTGSIDESSQTGEKGKVFDSSLTRGQPFKFAVGSGQVIKGWDQGLLGMCVGEKRELILPPDFGYGDRGAGADIPGGATLKFTVELLEIGEAPPQPNIFAEIDTNADGSITKAEMEAWFINVRGADKVPDGLFAQEDKDGDGAISWAEFSGPKGAAPPSSSDEL